RAVLAAVEHGGGKPHARGSRFAQKGEKLPPTFRPLRRLRGRVGEGSRRKWHDRAGFFPLSRFRPLRRLWERVASKASREGAVCGLAKCCTYDDGPLPRCRAPLSQRERGFPCRRLLHHHQFEPVGVVEQIRQAKNAVALVGAAVAEGEQAAQPAPAGTVARV